jgi:hypothetical protein
LSRVSDDRNVSKDRTLEDTNEESQEENIDSLINTMFNVRGRMLDQSKYQIDYFIIPDELARIYAEDSQRGSKDFKDQLFFIPLPFDPRKRRRKSKDSRELSEQESAGPPINVPKGHTRVPALVLKGSEIQKILEGSSEFANYRKTQGKDYQASSGNR